MKNIVVTLALAALVILGYSFKSSSEISPGTQEISFYKGSLKEAMVRARKEKKIIFLDIYAVWCGPCKLLKNTSFKDKNVSDYFNKNFVNLEIDGEKGEGKELVKKYGLKGYPSLLFIDSQGNIINKSLGYYDGKELLKIAKGLK
ncbi:thioredoxin family protein [Chryseobacterium sp. CT-SW4]|uniref:thioredoxin family protein n=1 Tax=Chryseobacterium sp. SW-1 TaxID=3157343 RepID=UPI003B02C7B6